MADLLDQVRLTDRLLDIRETHRRLDDHAARHGHGEPWPARARELMGILQQAHEHSGEAVLTIARVCAEAAAEDRRPHLALLTVAAAVELLDPTAASDEMAEAARTALPTYDVPGSNGGAPR